MNNLIPRDYINISAKFKSDTKNTGLIASDLNINEFYKSKNEIFEYTDEWVTKRLSFTMPEQQNVSQISIYFYYSGNDSILADDLRINITQNEISIH